MMTIKEVLKKFEGRFFDVEYFEYLDKKFKRSGFHTDSIRFLEEEPDPEREALSFELMTEDDYNNSILANSSETADFLTWYGDKNAKILCIAVKEAEA